MSMIGRPAARAPLSTADITDGTITSAKIAADVLTAADIAPNAVTNSEMADDAVGIAELSATGTAGTTTFLRGDNTWTVVDTEGTGIKSTGESGGTKFLREDGDGTSSWAVAGSPSISDGGNATAITIDSSESVTLAGTLAVTNPTSLTSLKPVSNQNLTGTYSDHEMIIGDQFTLTGDLTINDNLVLASLSGSGQDITITDDGNGRTITTAGRVLSCTTTNTDATVTTASTADLRAGKGVTGTGVAVGATIASVTNATTFELSAVATASGTVNLTFDTGVFEAGEFLGTVPPVPPQTDIGDMTSGVMNSAITGSPALNLINATSFPEGHIIGVKAQSTGGVFSGTSTSWAAISHKVITYVVKSASSKILINWGMHVQLSHSQNSYKTSLGIRSSVDSYASPLHGASGSTPLMVSTAASGTGWHQWLTPVIAYHIHGQAVGTTITYQGWYIAEQGNTLYSWDSWGANPSPASTTEMAIMMEIAT
jgi:hypothetical protein